METPPQFEQQDRREPAWQDITPEEIHGLIAEDKLEMALVYAQIRRRGIKGAITDIEHTLDQQLGGTEMDVTPEQWQLVKTSFQEELEDLTRLIDTISHELDQE